MRRYENSQVNLEGLETILDILQTQSQYKKDDGTFRSDKS